VEKLHDAGLQGSASGQIVKTVLGNLDNNVDMGRAWEI
jgi:hypothetical protein